MSVIIDGVWIGIGFIGHLQNVTTRTTNYYSFTELHTSKIILTTAHIKSFQFAVSSPVITWCRIPTMSSALCSCFYWRGTVSQLTHCSNCPAYNILARTAQKTPFLCCCFQLLPANMLVLDFIYLAVVAQLQIHIPQYTCHTKKTLTSLS
jgi:hypothetical protein